MNTILSGSTMLFDSDSQTMLRGGFALGSNDDGTAFMHVENDLTGIEERLDLTTPEQAAVVTKLMALMRETFTDVDLGIS